MGFKKGDPRASAAGKKGGAITQSRHREKILKNLKGRPDMCKNFNKSIEHQRKAGKMSRVWQNLAISRMKDDYDKTFEPFRVCDYICVKDGQLIFVEIKRIKRKRKEKLRPLQKEFKELCEKLGYRYEIIYIDGKRENFEGGVTDTFVVDLGERYK